MNDFFKYLTPGVEDVSWGIYLNVVGKTIFPPGTVYPSQTHPNGYYFTWNKGRILHEYQMIYITEGNGIFEDSSGIYPIQAGSLLILRPGKWHRYRPDINSGWTENCIGFAGQMVNFMFTNPLLEFTKPMVTIGIREEFFDTYYKIFNFAKEEKPGFQQVSAGMIMKLLGYLISLQKNFGFTETRVEKIIQKACYLVRENIEKSIDFKQYAEENNIAYSYFRRMFKMYTGLPPAQYHLDLKIIRSKELLLSTDKIIKEICNEVGFDSLFYFSRIFKSKTGISPTSFRTTAQNNIDRGTK